MCGGMFFCFYGVSKTRYKRKENHFFSFSFLFTSLIISSLFAFIIHIDSLGILKYPGYIFDYTQKKIESTNKVIYKHLDEKDTHYITPNLYKWTFMAQYSNCYEYYKFSAKNSSQSISLSPDTRNKLGFYVGWRWIFLGWSFDLDRQNTKNDCSVVLSVCGIYVDSRKPEENLQKENRRY